MKIETKLALKNMKQNMKRTIYTIISIVLCTFLILTTMITISSIKNGIDENISKSNNDYQFFIKNLDIENFNKIKDKPYIAKIYINNSENEPIVEFNETYTFSDNKENINVYIKYDNIRATCKYSTDILKTLEFTIIQATEQCNFNQNTLTVYGLIDVSISNENNLPICTVRVNCSYILDLIVILTLVIFSVLFIIILYNAFLITINERKKEYAVLNSVGGTESQILKMVFSETTIMAVIGIIIGALLSILGTSIILKMLNNVLTSTLYAFNLILDIKYIIISIFIIMLNIYISALIPAINASSSSVIQGIRNNKQIKYKKSNFILEKILDIECKMALKNSKRNKNKYRVITFLLVACMTSYIAISTYITYQKETIDLINSYDIDAELIFSSEQTSDTDYKTILNKYMEETGDKIDYFEYKKRGLYILVDPKEALETENVIQYADNKKGLQALLIGLDDNTYNNYIDLLNANYGDYIIYNTGVSSEGNEEPVSTYYSIFKKNDDMKLIITTISNVDNVAYNYEVIDDELLNINSNFILTDKIVNGFKDIKSPTSISFGKGITNIFVNMDTYNKINQKINDYHPSNGSKTWLYTNIDYSVRVKCENIIGFSNYIENFRNQHILDCGAWYFTLDNQEKIVFIDILQLISNIIIIIIIVIGIVSSINIINANLTEREQEFKILNSLGATKGNIYKILIFECIYMFIKALIISIILSIPILYMIINYMKNSIILNKLLIPFGNISLFFMLLFIISLSITLYSAKFIKNK